MIITSPLVVSRLPESILRKVDLPAPFLDGSVKVKVLLAKALFGNPDVLTEHFVSDFPLRTEVNIGIFAAGGPYFVQFNLLQSTLSGGSLFGF